MNFIRKQINYIIFLCLIFIFSIIVNTQIINTSNAQETCEKSSINVIIRDSQGNYIPSIPFQIYEQTADVDGMPKPSKLLAKGIIDPNLGNKKVELKSENTSGVTALKVWDKNTNVGEFWFYDYANISCGSSVEVTEVLSGIDVVFRDTEGNLRKNVSFKVYTQKYDVDGDPIKERSQLVGTFNTGESGEEIFYVADGTRSIDGESGDYYMIETAGKNGGTYIIYDITVQDGLTTSIQYVYSDMELFVKDAEGIPFPANTKVEIFKQEEDADGNPILGAKVKDITTDDHGKVVFEYPEGVYAARIKGANNEYQLFWDLGIDDEERNSYTLTADSDWDPGSAACEANSTLTIITRDLDNNPVSGLNYELYTQKTDVDGKQKLDTLKIGGTVDETGKGKYILNPDPRKKYALKIYDKNSKAGDFVYYNELQFICGEDKVIEKNLPKLRVVLRDGDNELRKNYNFSIYTQKFDVDGLPIKERQDLVISANTGETGEYNIYLAPNNIYDSTKNGTYVLTAKGKDNAEYNEYDIIIDSDNNYNLEYVFSDVIIKAVNGSGGILKNQQIILRERSINLQGDYTLGKTLKTITTDDNGDAKFEFPAGNYAVTVKDSLGVDNPFWQINIKNRSRSREEISVNATKIGIRDAKGELKPKNTKVRISSLEEVSENSYVVGKLLKTMKVDSSGYLEVSLKPNPYLFSYLENGKEYGMPLWTENGKLQEVIINTNKDHEIVAGQKYYPAKPASSQVLSEKLKGYILLQVEERGEAWYVDPISRQRYYMKDGEVAYEMLRKFGLGITNNDLKKIPIGIEKRFEEMDYDVDYVFDKMEEAIGTNMYLWDTDNDGFDDGTEILHDYNPTGDGKLPVDKKFAEKLKGKILLQVESHGEAWYVNPKDGRRYYMPDGDAAYEIMRFLSLGITNENLNGIEEGYIKPE